MKWGLSFSVGNGRYVRFWQDCWCDKTALEFQFHILFNDALDQDISVFDCYVQGMWDIRF